jgi:hypothetical protein
LVARDRAPRRNAGLRSWVRLEETIRAGDETILCRREGSLKQTAAIRGIDPTRGPTMWNIILALIYHRSCRKYLAGVRMQQQLWA